MEETIQKINEQLVLVQAENSVIKARVRVMEQMMAKLKNKGGISAGKVQLALQEQGKEESLTLTFGGRECPASSVRFLLEDHFNLAKRTEGETNAQQPRRSKRIKKPISRLTMNPGGKSYVEV